MYNEMKTQLKYECTNLPSLVNQFKISYHDRDRERCATTSPESVMENDEIGNGQRIEQSVYKKM